MERIFKISSSFEEAEKWEIEQEIKMSPEERQEAARILKERFYGKNAPDVRDIK